MPNVEAALAALRSGQPVLLYDSDGREGETDLVYASQSVTPEAIRHLRTDAGGLLCTTVAPEHHAALGLPFLADLLADGAARSPVLAAMKAHDLRYDPSKSSFGITINSRRTFTGIPDADRSLTITELAEFLHAMDPRAGAAAQKRFGSQFRTPGHVILLNGAPGGLARRQGHTELSIELARMAGLVPSTTICEMLASPGPAGEGSGMAMTKKRAQAYAADKGLVFLTGQEVLDAWRRSPTQAARPEPVPLAA